jgi:hypothetical protein
MRSYTVALRLFHSPILIKFDRITAKHTLKSKKHKGGSMGPFSKMAATAVL